MVARNGEGQAAFRGPYPDAPLPSGPAHRGSKGSILLIDPHRFSRERLELLLSSETPDFEVIGAASLESAPAGDRARAAVLVVNALCGASARAIASLAASKPVLWLCEHFDGDPDEEDFHIFPAAGSPALLAAALQLIVAGGRFSAPRRTEARTGAARREMARSQTEARHHVPAPA